MLSYVYFRASLSSSVPRKYSTAPCRPGTSGSNLPTLSRVWVVVVAVTMSSGEAADSRAESAGRKTVGRTMRRETTLWKEAMTTAAAYLPRTTELPGATTMPRTVCSGSLSRVGRKCTGNRGVPAHRSLGCLSSRRRHRRWRRRLFLPPWYSCRIKSAVFVKRSCTFITW